MWSWLLSSEFNAAAPHPIYHILTIGFKIHKMYSVHFFRLPPLCFVRDPSRITSTFDTQKSVTVFSRLYSSNLVLFAREAERWHSLLSLFVH